RKDGKRGSTKANRLCGRSSRAAKSSMKKETREWVRKAEEDLVMARRASQGKQPLHDGVCFHCQQCAEKYLTGLLEELGLPIPYPNILKVLLALLPLHPRSLESFRRGLTILTRVAVAARYPGENASKREDAASLRWAGRVRTAARTLLGL